jgi:hypothetical protein
LRHNDKDHPAAAGDLPYQTTPHRCSACIFLLCLFLGAIWLDGRVRKRCWMIQITETLEHFENLRAGGSVAFLTTAREQVRYRASGAVRLMWRWGHAAQQDEGSSVVLGMETMVRGSEQRQSGHSVLRHNAYHHRAAASDVTTSKDAARCSACMVLLCVVEI